MAKTDTWLSVDDAARVLQRAPGTIRNWIEAGALSSDTKSGVVRISRRDLEGAKLLREEQLLGLALVRDAGISAADLAHAIRVGAVRPSDGPDRRFAFADGETLVSMFGDVASQDTDELPSEDVDVGHPHGLDQVDDSLDGDAFGLKLIGEPPASHTDDQAAGEAESPEDDGEEIGHVEAPAPARPAGPRSRVAHVARVASPDVAPERRAVLPDVASDMDRTGQWPALIDYICYHGDPWRLPASFWAGATCPTFIAPRGVFRYTCAELVLVDGELRTVVRGTAGFRVVDGSLEYSGDAHFVRTVRGPRLWGSTPDEFGHVNVKFAELKRQWESCWRHHRLAALSAKGLDAVTYADEETSERRDRIALVRRAHAEDWAPCDYPDWAFCSHEPLEFVPRNNVFKYVYGDARLTRPGGPVVTFIVRLAGWVSGFGCPPCPTVATVVGWDWGWWQAGSTPARCAEANRDYAMAEADWRDEQRIRLRRRRDADAATDAGRDTLLRRGVAAA